MANKGLFELNAERLNKFALKMHTVESWARAIVVHGASIAGRNLQRAQPDGAIELNATLKITPQVAEQGGHSGCVTVTFCIEDPFLKQSICESWESCGAIGE